MKGLILAVCAFLAFALPAFAQEQLRWNDPQRLTVAAGTNYTFTNSVNETPQPPFKHEWEVAGNGSYSIVPRLGGTVALAYGVDNKFLRVTPELRLRLTSATDPVRFALGMGYAFYHAAGSYTDPWPHEWQAGAYGARAWPFTANRQGAVIVGGSVNYGFDNQQVRGGIDARVAYTFHAGGF